MATEAAENAAMTELRRLRDRMLPMLQVVARRYAALTDGGYPVVSDNVEDGGYFGISLAPDYGLYILSDGNQVWAQLSIVGWRTDARSSANREKFAGLPFDGLRPVAAEMTDTQLRDLIAELLSHWNAQPLNLHRTDS